MNLDCLYQILLNTDAHSVRSTANNLSMRWNLGDVTGAIERRLSPHRIFSDITDDVEALLDMMVDTKSILGGSRAANFLYPGCSLPESDFNFYVMPIRNGSSNKFIEFFTSIGIKWEETENNTKDSNSFLSIDNYIKSGQIQRSNRTYTIRTACVGIRDTVGALIRYHSSAQQCFVNGIGAFSLYHALSEKRLMIEWDKYTDGPYKNRRDTIYKYKNRGFDDISYDRYINEISKITNTFRIDRSRIRHIGDEDTRMIIFPEEYSPIKGKRERLSHIKMMRMYQWNEIEKNQLICINKDTNNGHYKRTIVKTSYLSRRVP